MTDADGIQTALLHYRTTWLTAWKAKDWPAVSSAWDTEYAAVQAGAFSAVMMTSGSFEGGSASAAKNFEQTVRLRALQLFRAELDADYADMLATPPPAATPVRRGMVLRFSGQ